MATIEVKGKTVDEAIASGLNELGLSIDEVDIEIMHDGTRGLFGIGRNAQVRLTTKSGDAPVAAAAPAEKPAAKPQKAERAEKREEVRVEREQRQDAPEAVEQKPLVPATSQCAQDATAFLNGLFKIMQLDAACSASQADEKTLKIDIAGEDTAVLIGRRGDTLDALQYLTSLSVNKGSGNYQRIMLDAENYRVRREQTLEKLAKRLASNVAKSGKPMKLEPMNPYERRVLHATLQNNPRVETFSEGVEPYRCVVIRRRSRSVEQ